MLFARSDISPECVTFVTRFGIDFMCISKIGYLLFGGTYTPNNAVCRRLRTADIDPDGTRFAGL